MSPGPPPIAATPDKAALSEAIARLRAECDAEAVEAKKGILLHEIGVLEDRAHNEGQAARDLLGAVNALSGFHEPLEELVVLIERRKSYKNLGKLVDRLAKLGDNPEELSRALVGLAEFREDHENDLEGAREALERAIEADGDDVDAWLSLDRIAARSGNAELRLKALTAREARATEPTWKALLAVDVARLLAAQGRTEDAIIALERALGTKNGARFTALDELGRVGHLTGKRDLVARALEDQADLAARALAGSTEADVASVPTGRRTLAHVSEALLRASDAHARRGETGRATALLERVLKELPDDPVALGARLRAAEAAGDTATAATLARRELASEVHGSVAASLFMRVAEAAASAGDRSGALEALSSALAEDPGCIPARTLQLHLLGGGDPAALAQALESAAAQAGSEELAPELFLLAADTWARAAGDVTAAKAALSQAAASGASLDAVARAGRMLAAVTPEAAWFDDATRRLLATHPGGGEEASLWFELGRTRLLRGDGPGAIEAFAALAATEGGAWLGSILGAYAAPLAAGEGARRPARDGAALEAVSALSPTAEAGRALRVASALRFALADQGDRAVEVLTKLHESDPADVVSATALSTLLRGRERVEEGAGVLGTSGAALSDPPLAAALLLEAGILLFRQGLRAPAIQKFEAAMAHADGAASPLLTWALRAAEPNDLAARKRALDAAAGEDPRLIAIERFALELDQGGPTESTVSALAGAPGEGPLGVALELARLLSLPALHDGYASAAEAVAARGDVARGIARGTAHFVALAAGGDPAALEVSAARWAHADGSAASALEWLAQAIAAKDAKAEVLARELLAERVGAGLRGAILASARLVGHLDGSDSAPPLLPGTEPHVLLTNLELAPPSCDPRRRASALAAGSKALDEGSRVSALVLAGWNLLGARDSEGALRAFRAAVDLAPEDLAAWEGLRAAAEVTGNRVVLAEASAALGDLTSDAGQGAELWERAGVILIEMGDAVRGEGALTRAVERDIGHGSAFDRLFRMVRARRDGPRLLELVAARLTVAEDPAEIAKLYWERARALRDAGDGAGAIEALDNVAMLEPDHVGALALTGEIYIGEKRFTEAAEALARLSRLPDAPVQQRLMSGMAATDLYENRLGQINQALGVLVGLHRAGLATLPVRERLARAAAKAEAWETATTVLEELMEQRETRAGRIEAARLAMAVHRDRLGRPAGAERAVGRLLAEAPDDGEALDLVLSRPLPKPLTHLLLESGREATIASLVQDPLDAERMTRLAEIARQLDDVQLRQVTLGAVVALGGQTRAILAELESLDGRVARVPQIAVDDRVVQSLRDPEDQGPLPELLSVLASTLAEALGPGLAALGVTKKERVRPQDGLPLRNEVAAWVGALDLGEFELYVGGRDQDGLFAVATEVPSLVIGASVEAPFGAVHRQALARELLALKLGTTILRHRDPSDVAAIVVAACRTAGVRLESPPYAMLAEFERLLAKEMPRRVRKVLPELARAVEEAGVDIQNWVQAAQSSLDRMATVAIGDVSWVLGTGEGAARGEAPATTAGRERATRLLSFVLSPTFFAVREKLGMGVR